MIIQNADPSAVITPRSLETKQQILMQSSVINSNPIGRFECVMCMLNKGKADFKSVRSGSGSQPVLISTS